MQTRKFELEVEVYAEFEGYVLGMLVQHSQNQNCYVIIDVANHAIFAQENYYSAICRIWKDEFDQHGEIK